MTFSLILMGADGDQGKSCVLCAEWNAIKVTIRDAHRHHGRFLRYPTAGIKTTASANVST